VWGYEWEGLLTDFASIADTLGNFPVSKKIFAVSMSSEFERNSAIFMDNLTRNHTQDAIFPEIR
jgi:hypothetical protein